MSNLFATSLAEEPRDSKTPFFKEYTFNHIRVPIIVKVYSLNHIRVPKNIVQGRFLNSGVLESLALNPKP